MTYKAKNTSILKELLIHNAVQSAQMIVAYFIIYNAGIIETNIFSLVIVLTMQRQVHEPWQCFISSFVFDFIRMFYRFGGK